MFADIFTNLSLVVGSFLAAAVCVGSLLDISNLSKETSKQSKGKQNTTSLWHVLGFNKTSAAKTKKKGGLFLEVFYGQACLDLSDLNLYPRYNTEYYNYKAPEFKKVSGIKFTNPT